MRVPEGPDGPEPHNGLLNRYKGTNVTGERVVNRSEMQLNDALIESSFASDGPLTTCWKVIEGYLRSAARTRAAKLIVRRPEQSTSERGAKNE